MTSQSFRRFLPAFIGGEDKTWYFYHSDDSGPLDLTGYTLSADVIWDRCVQYSLTEDNGLSVINLTPSAAPAESASDTNWHYSLTLSAAQTKCIPIGRGVAEIVLVRELDYVTTKRGPIGLERSA